MDRKSTSFDRKSSHLDNNCSDYDRKTAKSDWKTSNFGRKSKYFDRNSRKTIYLTRPFKSTDFCHSLVIHGNLDNNVDNDNTDTDNDKTDTILRPFDNSKSKKLQSLFEQKENFRLWSKEGSGHNCTTLRGEIIVNMVGIC